MTHSLRLIPEVTAGGALIPLEGGRRTPPSALSGSVAGYLATDAKYLKPCSKHCPAVSREAAVCFFYFQTYDCMPQDPDVRAILDDAMHRRTYVGDINPLYAVHPYRRPGGNPGSVWHEYTMPCQQSGFTVLPDMVDEHGQ